MGGGPRTAASFHSAKLCISCRLQEFAGHWAKYSRPVNSSEQRKRINKLFLLTTYLLCKYFLFIDNKHNNEWMNEWIFCYNFSWTNRLINCRISRRQRRLKLRLGNTFSSTQFSVLWCRSSARTLDLIWWSPYSDQSTGRRKFNSGKLILFLENNLDFGYIARPLSSLLFGKIFGTWFFINFGLLSAKICPGPVYS